jgi:hypothetical protein
MKNADLTRAEIDSLDGIAFILYASKAGGTTAVRDLAKLLRWEEFHNCERCETETPTLDRCCMACGNAIYTEAAV